MMNKNVITYFHICYLCLTSVFISRFLWFKVISKPHFFCILEFPCSEDKHIHFLNYSPRIKKTLEDINKPKICPHLSSKNILKCSSFKILIFKILMSGLFETPLSKPVTVNMTIQSIYIFRNSQKDFGHWLVAFWLYI